LSVLLIGLIRASKESYVGDSNVRPVWFVGCELKCLAVTRDYNKVIDVVVG